SCSFLAAEVTKLKYFGKCLPFARRSQPPYLGCYITLSLLLLSSLNVAAQERRSAQDQKPKPDLAEVHYGPHQRNVLDLWKAQSDKPAPLLVHIHGGGFQGGDKSLLPQDLLKRCLASGISVMTINYRLSPEVHFPAH